MNKDLSRPIISSYKNPIDYMKDMISYNKRAYASFSVLNETKKLRRVSPTLISLILQKKRKMSLDRIGEIGTLLKLTAREKRFLKDWIENLEKGEDIQEAPPKAPHPNRQRREVSSHILNDWVNVYVKDCFQISEVQEKPQLIYRLLANLASQKRLERAMQTLLKEGHLRITPEGTTVVDTPLTVTDQEIPDRKVQQFHKGALRVAREAIEAFPVNERYANALIIPLDTKGYDELTELIREFSEKLKQFAENNNHSGDRLYQLLINLSPTGGNNA